MRRSRWVVAVASVMAACSFVLFDPSAPAAMAWASPPPPVTMPSSVIAAGAGTASKSGLLAGLRAGGLAVDAAVIKAGATGSSAAGGVVAGGLMIGTYAGVQVAKFVGLPTSGDVVCDVQLLWNPAAACAAGALPDYVVNSDVASGQAPGWVGGVNAIPTGGINAAWQGSMVVDVVGSMDSSSYQIVWSYDGVVPGGAASEVSVATLGFSRDLVTGVVGGSNQYSARVWNWNPQQLGGTVTRSLGTGYGLDHVEVRLPSGSSELDLVWYPEGHVLRPPEAEPDPQRWWRTTWECSVGGGGQQQSSPFREADVEWPGFPVAQCDAGAVTSLLVEQITSGGPTTTITEWFAPAEVTDWSAAHPECVGGGCQLLLERQSDPTSQRWLSCHLNPSLCADWWTDPNKQDQYRCTYGGTVMAIEECDVYAPSFKPQTPTYTDPRDPSSDPEVGGSPDPDPGQQDDSCPPPFTWTSVVSPWWHYKAATCALQWAFVPPVGTTLDTAVDTDGTGLGDVQTIAGDFGAIDFPDATCGVIMDREISSLFGGRLTVDTCDEPWSSAGPLRGLIGAAFIVGTGVAILRIVSRAFGFRSFAVGTTVAAAKSGAED